MKNAWNAVAQELGLEDGTEAEKEFTKLRGKCRENPFIITLSMKIFVTFVI